LITSVGHDEDGTGGGGAVDARSASMDVPLGIASFMTKEKLYVHAHNLLQRYRV